MAATTADRPAARRARRAAGLAAVLALAAPLAACADDGAAGPACSPSEVPDHEERTIVVEGDPWSGYAPFRDPQMMAGTGYSTLYVEQLCQDVRAADLTAGRADVAVTTLDQYLLHRPEGTVVGVIDQSEGADALVLNTVDRPYLDSVDDLPRLVDDHAAEGDRPVLAYTGSSPSEMLLNELANTTDELRLSDYELVSVDQSATAYRMLQEHRADLAVVWEPDTSAARAAGYTVALSSEDVPDSIVDVIVAGDALIDRDPGAVQALVASFYRAVDRYLADPAELERLVAQDAGIATGAARSIIDGIRLYGTADADEFMNRSEFPLDQPRVDQSVGAISGLLALVHPEVRADDARVDGRYVHQAAGQLQEEGT
ncbi:MAG TPA: ABC transporter substrate-binding protein [Acidimicrobiales bacterium]